MFVVPSRFSPTGEFDDNLHYGPGAHFGREVALTQTVSEPARDAGVLPVDLRTEDDSGLAACAFSSPRLAWRLSTSRDAVSQLAYQLAVADSPDFGAGAETFPPIESERPFFASWPGRPLQSREVRWWRVRVRTGLGWSEWSDAARVEGSLYERADWAARAISPRSNAGKTGHSPVSLLRREFDIDDCVSARLYVAALGVYRMRINGAPVSGDLLEPGWTDYRRRMLFSAYDILPLLRAGRNCIAAEVSDGWWRGELGWVGERGHYGDTTALVAQIEIVTRSGERQVIATDSSWRGGYGAVQMAELYDGVDVDRRAEPDGWDQAGYDDGSWEDVLSLDLPPRLEQRAMPAIRILDRFEPAAIERLPGRIRIDAGQNIAGYLHIRARGPRGAAVRVRHAEMLEADGALHLAPLRNARAADNYILRGDTETEELVPSFTFHGFRYAEIGCDEGVEIDHVEVVQIGSDLDYSGRFACSNSDVNRLFANSVRSQKGNFIALPTDCPQRDERLGWTGDIQVFCETACLNADARSFLASWLVDLASEQRADGNIPSVVPNILRGHEYEFGGVGWGDAATLVPWTLYRLYGDLGTLERQYSSMCGWVDYGASRLDAEGVWTGDFHFGDWLDPGAPPGQPHMATTDRDFIATAYLSYSAARLAETAAILGHDADAERYEALAQRVAATTWARWRDAAMTTQAGCAIAIAFGIAPAAECDAVGARLAGLVERSGGRIATGFLGTPLILPALSRTGQTDAAYRLLLNRECPGWLYQVERGATTMWERWDAIGADGSLHAGDMEAEEASSMISFNHYAYGAVSAWLYANVAGIAPDAAKPGFGHIVFAPEPGGGLDWASASLKTAYGEAAIRWECEQGAFVAQLVVPPGATAQFRAPTGYTLADGETMREIGSGRHVLRLTRVHFHGAKSLETGLQD